MCALWSGHAGAAARCRCSVLLEGAAVVCCRVLLQGAAVTVECALWTGHAGAIARWLQWAVPLQGVACRALLEQCCVRFGAGMLVLLEGVAVRCLWHCGRWALMEITFMSWQNYAKKASLSLWLPPQKMFCYLGSRLA